MSELVLYHGDCRDGFGAAFAHWLCVGRDAGAEYIAVNYGGDWPDVGGREVVFVDFCPKDPAQTLELASRAKSVLVLDHHKSQIEAHETLFLRDENGDPLRDKTGAVQAGDDMLSVDMRFDLDRSGAGMTWDHFVNPLTPKHLVEAGLREGRSRPWLIDYIEDRDLWRFDLPHSKEVNAFIQGLPAKGPEDFGVWLDTLKRGVGHAAEIGRELEGLRQTYVDMMLGHVHTATLRLPDNRVIRGIPCVNAPYWTCSELVGAMAEKVPESFAFAWFERGDGKVAYMLRSKGGYDVSELAKMFGGGGHAAAAGFQFETCAHLRED